MIDLNCEFEKFRREFNQRMNDYLSEFDSLEDVLKIEKAEIKEAVKESRRLYDPDYEEPEVPIINHDEIEEGVTVIEKRNYTFGNTDVEFTYVNGILSERMEICKLERC